jgi:hypothetical protein
MLVHASSTTRCLECLRLTTPILVDGFNESSSNVGDKALPYKLDTHGFKGKEGVYSRRSTDHKLRRKMAGDFYPPGVKYH